MSKSMRLFFLIGSLAVQVPLAMAEDIDIYAASNAAGNRPNILVIIDNSANWSLPLGGSTKFAAIKGALAKVPQEEVGLQVIHDGVGDITESDLTLAAASGAVRASRCACCCAARRYRTPLASDWP